MLIYLDTVLWNRLCDHEVDSSQLIKALAQNGAKPVLGAEAVYELARAFQGKNKEPHERGKQLFSYLRGFVHSRIPCVQSTHNLLTDEANIADGSREEAPEVFLDTEQYSNLEKEVEKLSQGSFDSRANEFLKKRKAEAETARSDIVAYYQDARTAPLLKRMAAVPPHDVGRWIRREIPRNGRRVLRGHLARVFPGSQGRELTWIAKQLLASSRYRIANALTRADLYTNWRFSQSGSVSRDVPSDTYHIVNAAYCDVYATCEHGQAKYAPMVLTKTKFALCERDVALSSWLLAISSARRVPRARRAEFRFSETLRPFGGFEAKNRRV